MKKTNGKVKQFLKTKGFYAALAVCLVGSGVASWMAVDRTLTGLEDLGSSDDTQIQEQVLEDEVVLKDDEADDAPVDNTVDDVPIEDNSTQQEVIVEEVEETTSSSETQLFVMPNNGSITNTYSAGELVKSITLNDWRTHDGIDISTEDDADVKAAGAGTVTEVYYDVMWGNCIVIEHDNDITTYYFSLADDIKVEEGDKVEASQLIGYGSDSAAAECLQAVHVHFAVKIDGEWVDPLTIMSSVK